MVHCAKAAAAQHGVHLQVSLRQLALQMCLHTRRAVKNRWLLRRPKKASPLAFCKTTGNSITCS